MSNRQNFSPIGEVTSSSKRLEIDFNEQQALASRIKRTDSDLKYAPDVHPTQTDTSLRGISLHPMPESLPSQKAFMSLDISENSSGISAASVTIADSQRNEATRFNLSQAFNVWEEWQLGRPEATRYLENSDFMSVMQNRLNNGKIFEMLQDRADFTGIEVARLLGQYLKRSARTRMSKSRYSTTSIISGQDYMGGVETTLTTQENNRNIRHDLTVAAMYLVGSAIVEKKYSYSVVSNPRSIQEAGGFVVFSSTDGIPKSRLDAFAAADQHKNYPLDSLNGSIDTIRERYGII